MPNQIADIMVMLSSSGNVPGKKNVELHKCPHLHCTCVLHKGEPNKVAKPYDNWQKPANWRWEMVFKLESNVQEEQAKC